MRRLRENAAFEPEFNKTGEVVVEGHVIGRLDGFVFIPDAASGGSEAKTLQNAAQKALASEIAARATRLAEAPDGQFVLAADGTLRWTGAAVGKLHAGEEVLRPRLRLIADEHLTGAPREAVEARLDAFVKSHIEKLLGPLAELAAAADVTGIARGVAFQLVEALGVLDRQRVAEEVKGLEQPARATLRKYGVRFGAYHIYLPVLLKPAPRSLAVQLWALRHDGPQIKGLDDLLQLAGSGRTSIPVDREIDAALYRTGGYRVCGERAVRVDILERLADLIRPALAWRDGAGPKPPGAVAGGGFTVVNGMTSLTGASGEDFASILRSLGYRLERRPKPQDATITSPGERAVVGEQGEPGEGALTQSEATDAPLHPDPLPASGEREKEIAVINATGVENALQPVPELVTANPEPAPTSEPAATPPHPIPVAATAEPEMIEVWRPGRPEGRRGSRPRHRQMRGPARKDAPAAQPAEAAGPAVAAGAVAPQSPEQSPATAAAAPPTRHPHHRRRRPDEHRSDRPQRERERPQLKRFERRDKPPDPNSPFAKLAALKAQLEADAKERR